MEVKPVFLSSLKNQKGMQFLDNWPNPFSVITTKCWCCPTNLSPRALQQCRKKGLNGNILGQHLSLISVTALQQAGPIPLIWPVVTDDQHSVISVSLTDGTESLLPEFAPLQQAGLILLARPLDSESQICQRQLGIFVSDDQPLPASCSGGNRPEVCPIGIANGNRVLVLLGPELLCMPRPTSSAL
uniref:Protein kinase n=1 Tax=Citrus unshiu TaxID=55188 RepID=F8WL94_CITUN|nr:protein kinase [Citrus unshiu]